MHRGDYRSLLSSIAARAVGELHDAIRDGLPTVIDADIHGCFPYHRYATTTYTDYEYSAVDPSEPQP